MTPISHRHGIVDHYQCSGRHQYLRSRHGDNGCSRSRNTIDFDCHIVLIIHQHGVDLACRDAVAARGIEPDRHRAGTCEQLIVKHLGCDIIVKPRSFRDGAVKFKDSLRSALFLVFPFPEPVLFLHRNPPFLQFCYLHKPPQQKQGEAYCR